MHKQLVKEAIISKLKDAFLGRITKGDYSGKKLSEAPELLKNLEIIQRQTLRSSRRKAVKVKEKLDEATQVVRKAIASGDRNALIISIPKFKRNKALWEVASKELADTEYRKVPGALAKGKSSVDAAKKLTRNTRIGVGVAGTALLGAGTIALLRHLKNKREEKAFNQKIQDIKKELNKESQAKSTVLEALQRIALALENSTDLARLNYMNNTVRSLKK